MASIGPILEYLEAREALTRGDTGEAVSALERALGSPPGNPVVRDSLPLLLDHRSLAGEAALELVRVETRRRR